MFVGIVAKSCTFHNVRQRLFSIVIKESSEVKTREWGQKEEARDYREACG